MQEFFVPFGTEVRCRVHAIMLGSCWHVRPSAVHEKGLPGFCNSRVNHLAEQAVKRAPSRLAAVAACGGFAVRLLLRKTRRHLRCRSTQSPNPALTKVNARQQSMLDRLSDHAAALGGECLAIGYCHTKAPWQCRHGHTWDARPNDVLRKKSWCPECARNKRRIPVQRLQDYAQKRGGRCLSTSKHNRSKGKVFWQCMLGHSWEATPDSVLYGGSWCPKCSRKERKCRKRSLKDLQGTCCFARWPVPRKCLCGNDGTGALAMPGGSHLACTPFQCPRPQDLVPRLCRDGSIGPTSTPRACRSSRWQVLGQKVCQ